MNDDADVLVRITAIVLLGVCVGHYLRIVDGVCAAMLATVLIRLIP